MIKYLAIAYLMAVAFMAGTIYSTGTPYAKCPRLQDTSFHAFLESYHG